MTVRPSRFPMPIIRTPDAQAKALAAAGARGDNDGEREKRMLVLYHSGLTTCSRQVRHCLREKGLPYQSRYINLLRFEHLSPAYLKLNPNGVVPTLVHDGHVVINSACINEYLDEAFRSPRSRRPIRRIARACAIGPGPPTIPISRARG